MNLHNKIVITIPPLVTEWFPFYGQQLPII